jgi:hypothetical protein
VTIEARLAFIAFFVLCWCLLGLIPWAISAVWVRGRGAILALPLALAGACAGGVLVPLLGQRDLMGFLISLLTALIGSASASFAGIAFARRISAARPAAARPAPQHPIGSQRPTASEPTDPPASG